MNKTAIRVRGKHWSPSAGPALPRTIFARLSKSPAATPQVVTAAVAGKKRLYTEMMTDGLDLSGDIGVNAGSVSEENSEDDDEEGDDDDRDNEGISSFLDQLQAAQNHRKEYQPMAGQSG